MVYIANLFFSFICLNNFNMNSVFQAKIRAMYKAFAYSKERFTQTLILSNETYYITNEAYRE